jgi:hypothetical protein
MAVETTESSRKAWSRVWAAMRDGMEKLADEAWQAAAGAEQSCGQRS